jgi:phage FluMu protein Com
MAPEDEGEGTETEVTFDIGEVAAEDVPTEWQAGAIYTLEAPVKCPHCREVIRTLRAVRLLRTQVTFTSPLPRAGRVLVCPQCEKILSAELSGIL